MRLRAVIAALGLLGLFGSAQPQPIPEGIIVQPNQTSLAVQLGLDKASYAPGDKLRLTVTLAQDSYLYIYNIAPDGRVNLLFPNAYQPVNFLSAGVHVIPDKRYSLVISPPTGFECVQVLALAAPLPLEQLLPQGKFSPQQPFPVLSQNPKEFKSFLQGLIVGSVSTTGWAAAWTCFQTASPQARLRVVSHPSGALVSLNGIAVGQTPLEIPVAPGRYRVEVSRFGYTEWAQTVQITKGSEVTLEAQLTQSPFFRALGRTARLRIISDPAESDVFINNAYAGKTPLTLEIAPGRYRVVVTQTGYESWTQTIELKGESDITLEATLRALTAPPGPPPPPTVPPLETQRTVPFVVSLTGGLNALQIPSVGFELGFVISRLSLGLGASFSMTGEDVPEYQNVGSPMDLGPAAVYREGPETEFYGKISFALGGLGIDAAGGLAIQKEAHVALPLGPSELNALDVVVKPNGYQTEKVYLTGLIGMSLRSENLILSVGMHSRRGWVIGVGVVF